MPKHNENDKPIQPTSRTTEPIQQDKLNFFEKLIINKIIKSGIKKVKKYKKQANINQQERKEIETALLKIGESFLITDTETNEELNKTNIKTIPQQELLTLFEQTLTELKKEI